MRRITHPCGDSSFRLVCLERTFVHTLSVKTFFAQFPWAHGLPWTLRLSDSVLHSHCNVSAFHSSLYTLCIDCDFHEQVCVLLLGHKSVLPRPCDQPGDDLTVGLGLGQILDVCSLHADCGDQ